MFKNAFCHCERSEAISRFCKELWEIATSLRSSHDIEAIFRGSHKRFLMNLEQFDDRKVLTFRMCDNLVYHQRPRTLSWMTMVHGCHFHAGEAVVRKNGVVNKTCIESGGFFMVQ